jgi:hypothetical protein
MLTSGSITTETFSAALLGLEDLSLRVTAAALHVAATDSSKQIPHAPRWYQCHKSKSIPP